MIFELEERFAARSLVKLHTLLRGQQHVAIFQRLQMELITLLARGGAVSSKSEHVDFEACHKVNELRQLGGIHTRNRVHNGNQIPARLRHPIARKVSQTNRAQSEVSTCVFLESIERELVFAASQLFHAGADLVGQMERIAHHAPHKTPLVQKLGKAPKIGMEYGVTARNVKVRLTTDAFAEGLGLVDDLDHLLPRHALKTSAGTVGEDIAMFATLIAFIRNMPLEGKRGLLHRGTPLVDVQIDDDIGLQAPNGADGAILFTGATVQAVLRLYAIRVTRLDALLRTVLKTGTATDTRIGINTKTLNSADAMSSSRVKTARSIGRTPRLK